MRGLGTVSLSKRLVVLAVVVVAVVIGVASSMSACGYFFPCE